MSTRVGMGVDKPEKDNRPDSAVKKENAEIKKANEKLAKENDELIEKLNEASSYAKTADEKINALESENTELKAKLSGGKAE